MPTRKILKRRETREETLPRSYRRRWTLLYVARCRTTHCEGYQACVLR